MNKLNTTTSPSLIIKNPMGAGWRWFRQSLELLFGHFWRWLLIGFVSWLAILVAAAAVSLIHPIGNLLVHWLFLPPLMVGIMFCGYGLAQHNYIKIGDLFYGFRDAKRCGRIILVNLLWQIVLFLFVMVAGVILFSLIYFTGPESLQILLDDTTQNSHSAAMKHYLHNLTWVDALVLIIGAIVTALLASFVQFGNAFANFLVALPRKQSSIFKGFWYSLVGTWRNLTPLMVMYFFMALLFLLAIAIFALAGLMLSSQIPSIIAIITGVIFGIFSVLIILLLLPWWGCTMMVAFRQIYPELMALTVPANHTTEPPSTLQPNLPSQGIHHE